MIRDFSKFRKFGQGNLNRGEVTVWVPGSTPAPAVKQVPKIHWTSQLDGFDDATWGDDFDYKALPAWKNERPLNTALCPHPLISVIGAAFPTQEYNMSMGVKTGYALREIVERTTGTIFTGGVSGIGTDVYLGVTNYCLMNKTKDDRFFVLFPDSEFMPPSDEYYDYAKEIGKELEIASGGKDMSERRVKVGELSDYSVVLNGGPGTIDEGYQLLVRGKKLFCYTPSGGAARFFGKLKYGVVDRPRGHIEGANHKTLRPFFFHEDRVIKDLRHLDLENLIRAHTDLDALLTDVEKEISNGK